MRGFFGLFGRSRNGAQAQGEGSQVRIAGLEEEVRALIARVARLEANDVDRTAALHNAADKLNRASERYRKSRTAHVEGSGDGDAGDDWLRGYYALRGRGPSAAPAGPLVDDDDDDEEDDDDAG